MLDKFVAQSLIETGTSGDKRRLELTFIDARGSRQTLSLPRGVAADLVPVLKSLAAGTGETGGPTFTKLPKQWAVGRAAHERLVLIKFDDDPPYALGLEEAEGLIDKLRQESEGLSRRMRPALQ
jgi:hypothetical protein